MKTLTLMLFYFILFIGFFLLLSTIGMLFNSYSSVISNDNWFTLYALLFGWWLPIPCVMELHNNLDKA